MIADAMILIAAMAIGICWTLTTFDSVRSELLVHGNNEPSMIVQSLWKWSDLTVPCLSTWTVAIGILCLRRPRVRADRLFRRPGAVACAAVVASMLITVVGDSTFYLTVSALPTASSTWWFWFPDFLSHLQEGLTSYTRPRAEAVAVAWSLLFASGRWRPQPTWLDRLGRATGVAWMIVSIPHFFFPLALPGSPLM